MRGVLLTLAVLAGLGLAGAAAVVGFGLYNVSAQSGHWPGVSWVLHTTFRSSARLRAPSMEKAPDLGDPDLVALGAGHYATACAGCHAAPGGTRSATFRAMVPHPPPIAEAVADWQPNELHWIVENGVKMTGMPGWPVKGRGDEVWAVVAYLEAIKTDTPPPMPSPDLTGAAYCESCHGRVGGRVPRLDIQDAAYLEAQLQAYRAGERPSGIMAQAASLVPRDSFAELARDFAAREVTGRASAGESAPDMAGEALARRGSRDVPACLACHGAESDRKGPVLFGQSEDYLEVQLTLWRDGTYDHDKLMHAAARDLDDAEIAALSRYFARTAP